jgi:HicB family.
MFKIPKGYDTISKTFRLPIDLVEEMETLAAKNKISLNKLVTQCLQYAMDNIDTSEKDEL